ADRRTLGVGWSECSAPVRPSGTDSVLLLFLHDRVSRAAHAGGPRNHDHDLCHGAQWNFRPQLLHAGRSLGALLALCRYRVDLPVPAAVLDWTHKEPDLICIPLLPFALTFSSG